MREMSAELLFETRAREIDQATKALRPEFEGLKASRELAQVSELTGRLVKQVLKLPQGDLANHIPGIPIPLLLSSHSRLTVDLVPLFLDDFEANYGLSPKAMIQFARRKMIALNIRDYDPAGDRQAQAARYEKHRPFL